MSLAEKVLRIKQNKRPKRKQLKIDTPKHSSENDGNVSDETASFHSPLRYHNYEFITYKIPKRIEQLNIQHKYKSKKVQNKIAEKINQNREFRQFKLYTEEEVFKPNMLRLEMMFRASLDPNQASKTQDEDLDSDEELINRNKKESLNDLKNGINRFMGIEPGQKAKKPLVKERKD